MPVHGDFERPRPSVLNGEIMPLAGRQAAKFRKEPVSNFKYTDYERELRDRSWSLLMPRLERQYFDRWLAEMRRTRLVSIEKTVPDRKNYAENILSRDWIKGEDYRSSAARYTRLEMDIRNDRLLYPPFVETANIVAEFDRVRLRSLEKTPDLTPEERDNALGRVEENRLLVHAVQKSMHERADIYRYAFERLVIQTPDDAAISVERELLAFEAEIGVSGARSAQALMRGK